MKKNLRLNVLRLMLLLPLVGLFGSSYSLADVTELDLKEKRLRDNAKHRQLQYFRSGYNWSSTKWYYRAIDSWWSTKKYYRAISKLVKFLVDNHRPMNPKNKPMPEEEVGFFLNMIQVYPLTARLMGAENDEKLMLRIAILAGEFELSRDRDRLEWRKSNFSNTEKHAAEIKQSSQEIDSLEQYMVMVRARYEKLKRRSK